MKVMVPLVTDFDRVRNLKHAISVLGLEEHPHLQQARDESGRWSAKTWKLKQLLSEIIYRCDLPSIFQTLRPQARQHEQARAQEAKLAARALPPLEVAPLIAADVWSVSLLQHFRATARTTSIYSFGGDGASMTSLDAFLSTPFIEQRRRHTVPLVHGQAVRAAAFEEANGDDEPCELLELDDEALPIPETVQNPTTVAWPALGEAAQDHASHFFRVLHLTPGSKMPKGKSQTLKDRLRVVRQQTLLTRVLRRFWGGVLRVLRSVFFVAKGFSRRSEGRLLKRMRLSKCSRKIAFL